MHILLNQQLTEITRKGLRQFNAHIRRLNPASIVHQLSNSRARENSLRRLRDLVANREARFSGRILVDGMYDNPNYWLRLSMLRAALGLENCSEVGLLGIYNRRRAQAAFLAMGISNKIDLVHLERGLGDYSERARQLLAKTTDPAEILGWDLPHGVPGAFLYDALLRRQRAICVDLNHHKIVIHVADALRSLQAAGDIVVDDQFDLLVLSHHIDTRWSALTFAAIAAGIPVVALYGNMGLFKFVQFRNADDVFRFMDSPTGNDLNEISDDKAPALKRLGEKYLNEYRWAGRTRDLGAIYAFQNTVNGVVTKDDITNRFGWDPSLPIVSVYLGNGWDNIHGLGMSNFRDLKDWLLATLEMAVVTNQVNWLFRGHPVDQWYQGANLADVIPPDTPSHIRLCDTSWNNADVLSAVDGVVTYHGTVGVEFAAKGKPVLLADRGWYHDCGFAVWSKSRTEYLSNLAKEWWQHEDLPKNRGRALLFSGLYFCAPEWQGQFVTGDDSERQSLYQGMEYLLDLSECELEIESIWAWFQSGHVNYHTWKMLKSERYLITNAKK